MPQRGQINGPKKAKGQQRSVGLARALSKLGYCSRSRAVTLILGGQVSVNGKAHRDPEWPVNLELDRIAIQGQGVARAKAVYLMLNKPRGIVTTAADEKGRDTVYHLLPPELPWIAPVGRLDKASEGLLLMTNDSEWGARITDPGSHVEKTYHVQINALPSDDLVKRLEAGVRSDGEMLRARKVKVLRAGDKNCWLEIRLDEGKNRQIRRMLEAMKISVLRLIRVSIGPLQLGDLPKGSCRELTSEEERAFRGSDKYR